MGERAGGGGPGSKRSAAPWAENSTEMESPSLNRFQPFPFLRWENCETHLAFLPSYPFHLPSPESPTRKEAAVGLGSGNLCQQL
ncbi:Acylamino-acid-releasing enzyme [Manis javanica]|nr:Acylamino-acid-releasing enzyme [Manis javanica]